MGVGVREFRFQGLGFKGSRDSELWFDVLVGSRAWGLFERFMGIVQFLEETLFLTLVTPHQPGKPHRGVRSLLFLWEGGGGGYVKVDYHK